MSVGVPTISNVAFSNRPLNFDPGSTSDMWEPDFRIGSPAQEGTEEFLRRYKQEFKGNPRKETKMPAPKKEKTLRRIRVFIADTDPKLPIEDRELYSGPEVLTDKTDKDIYFSIPDLAGMLERHNEKRKNTVNKTVKSRNEYLEPIDFSDLSMVITTIAEF